MVDWQHGHDVRLLGEKALLPGPVREQPHLVLAQGRLSRLCAPAFAEGFDAQAAPSGAAPFASTRESAFASASATH